MSDRGQNMARLLPNDKSLYLLQISFQIKSDIKKFLDCPFWCQSGPIFVQIYHPCTRWCGQSEGHGAVSPVHTFVHLRGLISVRLSVCLCLFVIPSLCVCQYVIVCAQVVLANVPKCLNTDGPCLNRLSRVATE